MSAQMVLVPDAPIRWPLLDEGDCRDVAAAVLALRSSWLQRHPAGPFFSLGAASYLDANGGQPGRDKYEAMAAQYNPALEQAFGPLFARVTTSLADHLQAPVVLTKKQALPGFHVFLSHPAFEQQVAPIHIDLQHRLLDWEGVVPEATLSITLPILVPEHGASMNVWGVLDHDWPTPLSEGWQLRLKQAPRYDIHYTPGEMVFHSGRFVHRIAPARSLGPDDIRMTLQAHGVLLDGVWQIYW
jgi:hypothetical protein